MFWAASRVGSCSLTREFGQGTQTRLMRACLLRKDEVSICVDRNVKVSHMYPHISTPSQSTPVKPGVQSFPWHPTPCARSPGCFGPHAHPRTLTRVARGCRAKGAGGVSLCVPPAPPPSQPRAAIKEAVFSLQNPNLILHLKARGD